MGVAAAGLIAGLGAWAHSLHETLQTLRGYQARLEALEDSMHTVTGSDPRVPALESRVASLEKNVPFNARAARVPEVIALRRWMQRLDAVTRENARRIAQFEHSVDSTVADLAPTDSAFLSTASPRRSGPP
jgi:hypothetical protein